MTSKHTEPASQPESTEPDRRTCMKCQHFFSDPGGLPCVDCDLPEHSNWTKREPDSREEALENLREIDRTLEEVTNKSHLVKPDSGGDERVEWIRGMLEKEEWLDGGDLEAWCQELLKFYDQQRARLAALEQENQELRKRVVTDKMLPLLRTPTSEATEKGDKDDAEVS